MTATKTHEGHTHQHGVGCGHTAIEHEGHVDFLHDGHLHHQEGGHVDEHVIAVSARIRTPAPPTTNAAATTRSTCTAPTAGIRPSLMVTTSTIWSTGTCIIPMATIATIMGR